MGFLRRLFGGEGDKKKAGSSSDPQGLYFYVECNRCHTIVRLRADKQYDLNDSNGGYVWNKTIVDSRCFQRMPAVVHLDRQHNLVSAEIEGGRFVTEADYNAWLNPPPAADETPADTA